MDQNTSCQISIYPDPAHPEYIGQTLNYMRLAASIGYSGVFSSVHLPEYSYLHSLGHLMEIRRSAAALSMEFTLDISGGMLETLLQDSHLMTMFKKIEPDFLRLDYGYVWEQAEAAYLKLGIQGFALNASTLRIKEAGHLIARFRALNPGIRLQACHNFYPRPETGLSMEFMVSRSLYYQQQEIPVISCVPSLDSPRLPLFLGLPTVEAHRLMPSGQAVMELLKTGVVDSVLIGDAGASRQTLEAIAAVCRDSVPLAICLQKGVTEAEMAIIFGSRHQSRPDPAAYSIRSLTSRQMASQGQLLRPNNMLERPKYTVTIDNERYLRYSGELQITATDLPADERVNIVGHIAPSDHGKIDSAWPGMKFHFVRE